MIAHIVLVKLTDKADAPDIKARLDALPGKIEQIRAYEIGIDEIGSERSFDLSLYARFESYDDLKIYNQHPDHQAVLAFIRERAARVHAVDYTL